MNDYITSENEQAMPNNTSAPYQLVPINSYNTELLQDMQSSFQLPNPDTHLLDRIQFGNQ